MNLPGIAVKTTILCALLSAHPSLLFAISLTKVQDLEFGSFMGGAGYSGSITIDPSGERYASGRVRPMGNHFSPARFTLKGYPGERYSITLPSVLQMDAAAEMVEVSSVTCSIPTRGVIPPAGAIGFAVGGTLSVGSTLGNGNYLGNLQVTVSEN